MVGLAESGMTMLCVAHEIDFDKTVADRVFFIDADRIIEDNAVNAVADSRRSTRR